ncbi:DUF3138 family protein [Paraburkholderia sp. 1N]|uniref:DUF3138 family protein n=1 Tax=Paraburkholderia solitsugae TaxID=2675748 RepID=A0ABX2BK07_9BURK|nr:DUF3138 family protein [Paraburkholderia solitsugae]NPT40271.1 DUF3138 family protein [Paraburkholderia solitsugae]
MKVRTVCALLAGLPGFAMASPIEDQVKQLEAKVKALEALTAVALADHKKDEAKIKTLEVKLQAKDPAASFPGPQMTKDVSNDSAPDSDDAPALLTQGQLATMKQQIANQQLKVNNLNDAANSGPLAGLSVTGYIDPAYVASHDQRSSSFRFLNKGDPYTYYDSSIGDVYLDIKKTFGQGTYAPSVELQIMPSRGYGTFSTNSSGSTFGNIFNSAVVNVPLSDTTTFVAGYIPSFAGYEYQQSTLNLAMSHGLLFDFSEPGTYIGAGLNYATGNWAWKTFLGNEEYQSSAATIGQWSNRTPTVTGRVDYTWSSALDLGGSFSWGRNTLPAQSPSCGQAGTCGSGFGYQGTSSSPFGSKFYVEGDLTYALADVQLNAQLDYGQLQGGAWSGGTAQWYGLSLLAHRKWTMELLGRMGATLRFDYLNDQRNGGGGGGTSIPSGTDGLNGFGIAPSCLASSATNGSECKGANRMEITGALLFYPTNQITVKAEYRHDWSNERVFQRLDGEYVKSNDVLGVQFIYAY